jgi:hypothetical protein
LVLSCALPAAALAYNSTFDLLSGTGHEDADYYDWNDPILTVKNGADIKITGSVSNGRRIEVAENANAKITLDNVYISANPFDSALLVKSGADVTLTWTENSANNLQGGVAGIWADNATLRINGPLSGTMTVKGSESSGGCDSGMGMGGVLALALGLWKKGRRPPLRV